MLKRSGELFTLTTYSAGARDDYEDVAYTSSTGFAKVRGLRLNRDAERQYIDQTGEVSVADVAVLFAYPVKDEQGNAVTISDLTTSRLPTLTDTYGRSYTVVSQRLESTAVGGLMLYGRREFD
jgi:hypothetical protein